MTKHGHPGPKVARLLDEYGLSQVGEELEERWTRRTDRSSLRELADYFNRELLVAALDAADSEPLEGEVDNLYRLLTEDDVTSGSRQEARSRLERNDVDVETLENDFVSYQAVRTYLRKYRDVTPPESSRSSDEHRETKRNTVQQLVSRLTTVADGALTELARAGNLTLGEFDVVVTVRVHCRDCDTRLSITDLLSQGGCQCGSQN